MAGLTHPRIGTKVRDPRRVPDAEPMDIVSTSFPSTPVREPGGIALAIERAEPALLPALFVALFLLMVLQGGEAVVTRWECGLLVALLGIGLWGRSLRNGKERSPRIGDTALWVSMAPSFILVADASRRAADGRLDMALAALDTDVLGGPAALWFYERFPALWIHEWLAFAYLSYYLFIPVGPFIAWSRGPRQRVRAVFAVGLSYALATMWELVMPTAGPLSMRAQTVVHSGPMKALVDWIYRLDATGGAAFPSSHVAVGTVGWWVLAVHHRALGLWTAPVLLSLWIATIQGSFHYTLDVPPGLLLAALVILLVRPGSVVSPDPTRLETS